MRLSWPLIGRTEQMRTIESAIAAPNVAGAVVSGVAGVGKTRIAREALSFAKSRGFEVRWIVGSSSARCIPLGAFAAWTRPGATETVQLVRGVIDSLVVPGAGARVVLARGEEADAVLGAVDSDQLTDVERARLAFLRASNMLWALGDPQAAVRAADELVLADLPPVVGAEIGWALTVISGEAGRTADAEAYAQAGYLAATRRFDAPQMRLNIADAHLTVLLLSGRVREAVAVAQDAGQRGDDLPGDAQLLGAAVAGRAAVGAGQLATGCGLLKHATSGLSAAA
ncbi:ATP-binding protein [Mycolicibacterium sarraceniae]|uniref:Transcriptional regulator n=1 Tax=Mycolicibacterium sarraceniae TaxID=1534348 RepID=A0A7I7SLF2_9MYCO|nr:ATP-binding protein [Mycolicibacterium sarraceniae]BBY57330.1 hypothetical protein MSAR_04660 [Mycolicibacterium sarraceniae]